jgi:hypothetical protein
LHDLRSRREHRPRRRAEPRDLPGAHSPQSHGTMVRAAGPARDANPAADDHPDGGLHPSRCQGQLSMEALKGGIGQLAYNNTYNRPPASFSVFFPDLRAASRRPADGERQVVRTRPGRGQDMEPKTLTRLCIVFIN